MTKLLISQHGSVVQLLRPDSNSYFMSFDWVEEPYCCLDCVAEYEDGKIITFCEVDGCGCQEIDLREVPAHFYSGINPIQEIKDQLNEALKEVWGGDS